MLLVNPLPETEAFSPATAATNRVLCGRRWGRNIAHSGIASGRMDKVWTKRRGAEICSYAHGSAHDEVEHEEVCFINQRRANGPLVSLPAFDFSSARD
jgi:hypothetical protein